MNIMNNQQLKESTPAALEEWLSLLVLLQKLQERLAEDRQTWAATGGDMALVVEALRLELQRLQELRPQVEQEVKQSLLNFSRQTLQVQATEVSRQLTAVMSSTIEGTIQRLNQAAQQATHQLQDSQNYHRQSNKWILIFAIILCIVSSISGSYFVYVFDPVDRLSGEQWQLIQDGTILRKAWPGLNKPEQDKIMALSYEKAANFDLPSKTCKKSHK